MLTSFARRVGLEPGWEFTDVFGLDEELLMMVPQPCKAVTLLFPTAKLTNFRDSQAKSIESEGQHLSKDLFYIKQHDTLGNACGTIAAVHCLANSGVPISGGVADFVAKHRGGDPDEAGWALAEDSTLKEASESSAQGGQTETPDRDAQIDYHFICFVPVEGHLYELDGRKKFPINHGATSPETFLADAARTIKDKFMSHDPENLNFNVMALVQSS